MRKGILNLPASKLPLVEHPMTANDFRDSFHWRVFRIMAEFVDGWNFLADFPKTVTFFGSARFPEDNHWSKEARKLGKMCTKAGISVITGGGPGIMEAGNRGAVDGLEEAKLEDIENPGDSLGLNIKLPFEQRINPYVEKAVAFHYFFVRKVMLAYAAKAYIYFPGGFGTLDEWSEMVTLVQTHKVPRIPIVMVGREFWEPFNHFIRAIMFDKLKAIDADDMNLYTIVDSAAEAFEIIKKAPDRHEFAELKEHK